MRTGKGIDMIRLMPVIVLIIAFLLLLRIMGNYFNRKNEEKSNGRVFRGHINLYSACTIEITERALIIDSINQITQEILFEDIVKIRRIIFLPDALVLHVKQKGKQKKRFLLSVDAPETFIENLKITLD